MEQSLLRGGSFSFTLKSFNPPSSARNWANRYVKERRDSQLIHHSTYLTTPKEWLGPRFLADAERLKAKSETSYLSLIHIFFEEMSELQKELCKHDRGKDNREAIAEEIADVQIMLEQMIPVKR